MSVCFYIPLLRILEKFQTGVLVRNVYCTVVHLPVIGLLSWVGLTVCVGGVGGGWVGALYVLVRVLLAKVFNSYFLFMIISV